MKVCTALLRSVSPYSQSRQHETPKLEKEGPNDYELRTWRNKAHFGDDRIIYIPPMGFKQCLDSTAKFLSIKIPGKGTATYTKHFLAGVLVMDKLSTGISVDEVEGEWIHANANGVRGSGKRVKRCFPLIPKWEGEVTFYILDEEITKDIFERILREAGQFRGIGRFRPENGGFYGRFEFAGASWSAA